MYFLKFFKLGLGIFFLSTFFWTCSAQKVYYKFTTVFDLPRRLELEKFVPILKNITNFYFNNINNISISVAFGIFIGNVHLGHALRYEKDTWNADLIDIFIRNEEILNYYRNKIAHEESGRECVEISQLFSNASAWIARVAEFRPPRIDYTISRDFQRLRSWSEYAYVANVRRAYLWIPNPKQSDECLKLLAESDTAEGVCLLDDRCLRVVNGGSDIGYALCHRVLLVLMARYSRVCSISPGADSDMLDTFCSMSYAEALYIAHYDFGLVDLILEHMSLCILHGRTEFLRRSWLKEILEYQTAYGCFSQSIDVIDDNNDLLEGRCSGHTTALATSVLAGAVRFILEKY